MQFEPGYYTRDGFCFCPLGGRLPEGAERVGAPFSPLIFLVNRPSAESRGFYAIHFGA